MLLFTETNFRKFIHTYQSLPKRCLHYYKSIFGAGATSCLGQQAFWAAGDGWVNISQKLLGSTLIQFFIQTMSILSREPTLFFPESLMWLGLTRDSSFLTLSTGAKRWPTGAFFGRNVEYQDEKLCAVNQKMSFKGKDCFSRCPGRDFPAPSLPRDAGIGASCRGGHQAAGCLHGLLPG